MKFEVYKSRKQWRWRLRASNGKIVATSGEAYKRRASALKGVLSVALVNSETEVVVEGVEHWTKDCVAHITDSGTLLR